MADPNVRTGTVEPLMRANGAIYFKARITHGDGYRERVDIPKKHQTAAGGLSAKERAALYAQALQEREDQTGERQKSRHAKIAGDVAGSVDRYAIGVFDRRTADGLSSVPKERRIWKARVSPKLGKEPMATVSKETIEEFRSHLDDEVRKRIQTKDKLQGISGKTALIIWTLVRTICKEASGSREPKFRVRPDDPSHGIKPPLSTRSRQKTFLYPSEFAQLMSCEGVPLEWRETYAIGAYLYLRPGELRALTADRIDIEAGVVHILEAFDEESDEVKGTKTEAGQRQVPIQDTLMPLLRRLRARLTPEALVCPLLAGVADNKRAILFRKHLHTARLGRPRLLEDTATTIMINFRSLRDSGITWECLCGTPVERIRSRAGHETLETTLGYIKAVEDLHGKLGEPFGPLPFALPEPSSGLSRESVSVRNDSSGCWTRTSDERELTSTRAELMGGEPPKPPTRVDVSARQPTPSCPTSATVERALVEALRGATEAGRWEDVARLSRELGELAKANEQTVAEHLRDRVREGLSAVLDGDEDGTRVALEAAARALDGVGPRTDGRRPRVRRPQEGS